MTETQSKANVKRVVNAFLALPFAAIMQKISAFATSLYEGRRIYVGKAHIYGEGEFIDHIGWSDTGEFQLTVTNGNEDTKANVAKAF
jgi:hypothetical protein